MHVVGARRELPRPIRTLAPKTADYHSIRSTRNVNPCKIAPRSTRQLYQNRMRMGTATTSPFRQRKFSQHGSYIPTIRHLLIGYIFPHPCRFRSCST
jgi:hypothetical protein